MILCLHVSTGQIQPPQPPTPPRPAGYLMCNGLMLIRNPSTFLMGSAGRNTSGRAGLSLRTAGWGGGEDLPADVERRPSDLWRGRPLKVQADLQSECECDRCGWRTSERRDGVQEVDTHKAAPILLFALGGPSPNHCCFTGCAAISGRITGGRWRGGALQTSVGV